MMNWDIFKKFDSILSKYMPSNGEGETMASQTATAINKLIYKWYNDGDVYDNQTPHNLGWANDLSSYANWLHRNIPGAATILEQVWDLQNKEDAEMGYTEILYTLADKYLCEDFMSQLVEQKKTGSIYRANSPFHYSQQDDEPLEEEF